MTSESKNNKPKTKPKKKSLRGKFWLPPIDINELSREMDMDETPPNYKQPHILVSIMQQRERYSWR